MNVFAQNPPPDDDLKVAVRRVDVVGGAIVTTLLAAAWFGEIGPTRREATALTNDAARVHEIETESETFGDLRAQLGAELAGFESGREELDRGLPRLRDEARLLQDVIALASRTGLVLGRLEPRDAVGDEQCESVAVRIAGEGPFAAIHAFVRELSRMPRAHRIGELVLTGGVDNVSFELEQHVFRRPAGGESGDERDGGDDA